MRNLPGKLILINVLTSTAVLGVTAGILLWVLRLDAEERMVGLFLVGFSLLVGTTLHFLLVRPLLPRDWQNDDVLEGVALLRAFPARAAQLSWFLWIGLNVMASLTFYLFFGEWASDDSTIFLALVMFLANLAGGGISFLFQFYAYKLVLARELRRAAGAAYEQGYGDRLFDKPLYSVRNKLIVSALTLVGAALLFSFLFGYVYIAESMQERMLLHADAEIQRVLPVLESEIDQGRARKAAEGLSQLHLGLGGQLILLDKQQRPIGGHVDGGLAEMLRDADEVNWRSETVVRRVPAAGGEYVLAAVFPWRISEGALKGVERAFLFVFVGSALIILAIASFSARDVAQPVREIVRRAERIARGDLSEPVAILSGDELGDFSFDLEQVRRFLRGVVNGIERVSGEIDHCSASVAEAALVVDDASGEQALRVRAGLAAVEKMSRGFQRIAEGGVELTAQASTVGSAIYQLDATVQQVDKSTEVMLQHVSRVHEGIERTNRIGELIFATLGDLLRSVDVAVRNVRKFSDSIRRNEERANLARAVSERVYESCGEGIDLTRQTTNSIAHIENGLAETAGIRDELFVKLKSMGSLIGLIDEVADDTKLLSLNAAIIAAQAGDKGRSFSVLAEKIKTLADRTNGATLQIISMIDSVSTGSSELSAGMEEVRRNVAETRDVARRASESLQSIIVNAQTATEGMNKVAQHSSRYVDDGENVERAVVGLSHLIDGIHAAVRQQLGKAKELEVAMQRVEGGSRTVKSLSRAQAEGGRVLASGIEQVITMVEHLKRILDEQQAQVREFGVAMTSIESEGDSNHQVTARLRHEVDSLHKNAETFRMFVERFKLV